LASILALMVTLILMQSKPYISGARHVISEVD
jgi:hypothetical protein